MDDILKRIIALIGPKHGASKAFAAQMGFHPNVITNWKNGRNKSYMRYIKEIAELYGVTEEYLLTGKEDSEPEILPASYREFAQLLRERGVTSYRVYKETGVSQATLSDWKTGKSVPKIDKLQKIADYFNVPVSYFLGDENEKTQVPGEGDPRSVEEILAWTRRQLETQEGLMFDGGVASDEAIESILAAMKIGLELAKSKSREEKQRAAKLKAEILAEAEKADD